MSETDKTVSAVLDQSEELLWSGRPQGGIHGAGFFVLFLALVPCVLGIGGAFRDLGPPYLLPIGWLTVLGALFYFVFGRLVVAEIHKGRIFYGLTARRAIILFGVFKRQVRSIDLSSLRDISFTERPDHTGTIWLGVPPTGSSPRPTGLRGLFWPGPLPHTLSAFLTIDSVKTVYGRVIDQKQKCGGG
jgi:hypothetical protein